MEKQYYFTYPIPVLFCQATAYSNTLSEYLPTSEVLSRPDLYFLSFAPSVADCLVFQSHFPLRGNDLNATVSAFMFCSGQALSIAKRQELRTYKRGIRTSAMITGSYD